MSDNFRRFRSIHNGLKKMYPSGPKGNVARHLFTLAALISGIVGGKSSHLPSIASKVADARKPESRVKAFSRWIANEKIDYVTYFLPYVKLLIDSLMHRPLVIIFDASTVGRNCITLVASIVYKSRALPICWMTQTGKKGHLCESIHLELVQQVYEIIPSQANVIFLGDGEFDGTDLLKTVHSYGWEQACRTSKNRIFNEQGEQFSLQNIGVGIETYFQVPSVYLADLSHGPFNVLIWWTPKYQEPIYLITNIELVQEAIYWYRKRFNIETMFSDKKSRGFNLHKSHISDPERFNRLLIATCLAYIWIVWLGALAMQNGMHKIIHRTDRCDLSLFQLGLRMIEHHLNSGKKIAVAFQMNLFDKL